MKPHRAALLSLLLLIAVIGNLDAYKTDDAVKKVGKRLLESIVATPQRISFWFKTDEEVQAAKSQSAQIVAEHLMRQSSKLNLRYEDSAKVLYSLMSSDFEGGICGEKNMGYYEMTQYWKRQRELFKRNDKQTVTWRPTKPEKEDHVYHNFFVSFKTHSTWGYSATPTYIVNMQLLGATNWGNYSIISIEEVGACTEHGTVETDATDVGLTLYEFDPERINTRDKILEFVRSQFETNKTEYSVPTKWIRMTAGQNEFEGKICQGETLVDINRNQLFQWFKYFRIMYHPVEGDTEHTRIQLLGGEYDRFVFRATYRVQIGHDKEAAIQEFDLKFQYAEKPDKTRHIDKMEVMCPKIARNTMMDAAVAYREIIGKQLSYMIETPELWYTAANQFEALTKLEGGYGIQSCKVAFQEELETVKSFADLKKGFWALNREWLGKMEGYDMKDSYGGGREINETMRQSVWIVWTPPAENQLKESQWIFTLEWHQLYQFYFVVNFEFKCPETGKGNEQYSSIRPQATKFMARSSWK